MSLIRLRWTTRKIHRRQLRSRRLHGPSSHLKRSPRQPPPSAELSRRLIVCPTTGLHVCPTFAQCAICPSEEFTTGMALILTPPTVVCDPLFTKICKPDSNSVSDHTKGTQRARCHWHCRDRPFLVFFGSCATLTSTFRAPGKLSLMVYLFSTNS